MPRDTDKHVIRAIQFLPDDDVIIEYFTPEQDIKSNGLLLSHQILLPGAGDYYEHLDVILDTAQALLVDGLDDHERLGPLELPTIPEGEDDDREPNYAPPGR